MPRLRRNRTPKITVNPELMYVATDSFTISLGYPRVIREGALLRGDHEIVQAMDDLRDAGVDILTLGQYLRPTPNHLAVERYVTPEEFDAYRREGLEKGFLEVVAGPLIRSSYRADRVLQKNNVGIAI